MRMAMESRREMKAKRTRSKYNSTMASKSRAVRVQTLLDVRGLGRVSVSRRIFSWCVASVTIDGRAPHLAEAGSVYRVREVLL
jgi:hypothetical protein